MGKFGLGIKQPTVAGMERPGHDLKLSSLKRYVEATGGKLRVDVEFPDGNPLRIPGLTLGALLLDFSANKSIRVRPGVVPTQIWISICCAKSSSSMTLIMFLSKYSGWASRRWLKKIS